ncbi:hypothetical protein Tco_1063827 [Tanacetum coccineum]
MLMISMIVRKVLCMINLDGALVDAKMGNTPVATHELRPLLRMLAGSSASGFDILKILDERKESIMILRSH